MTYRMILILVFVVLNQIEHLSRITIVHVHSINLRNSSRQEESQQESDAAVYVPFIIKIYTDI